VVQFWPSRLQARCWEDWNHSSTTTTAQPRRSWLGDGLALLEELLSVEQLADDLLGGWGLLSLVLPVATTGR
jgi:hypothetical protein